ncbi:MAG: ATP-binding cassette domain-containing protein, partial [Mailhella sp.]|nr:ATP-binding cassette domain-containing protein [Mailhella sp.]
MNVIIQDISKSFGGRDIFQHFSLDIQDGVRLCVCGPNGTGKSTLLRIMAGVSMPDGGRVIIPKDCRVGYVEQILDEAVLDKTLLSWVQEALPDWRDFWEEWERAQAEGNESLMLSLMERQHELEARYGYNPEQRAQTVLSGLGFSSKKWTLPLRQLSGGWRERAKLARVLTAGADALLLDEPTNHLDLEAVEWLEEFLMDFKGVLVFVAHDRVFMDHVGTHVLYLGASRPIFRKCSFSKFMELQAELEEQRERAAKQISDEIERKMDFVRRFKAKATKARQAGSKQKQAKKLEKELEQFKPEAKRRELSFHWPESAPSEKVVMSVADLSFSFSDGTKLWPPLTFSLFRGQRIGLVGHNGCGKSTLLKILVGALQRTGGTLVTGAGTRLGYYSQQQTETLNLGGTVLGEMRRLSDPKTSEEELMSVLGLFLLGQGYFDREVSSLSGGERSRLALALLFLRRCNFLVLDEPTNHLDLESRDALVDALGEFDGTLLVVAHDRYLLSEAVDEIWAVDAQGVTVYKEGFAQYDAARHSQVQKRLQDEPAEDKKASDVQISNRSRDDIKKLKREQAEQRNAIYKQLKPLHADYEKKEKDLETVLSRHDEVEKLLADPEVYADGSRVSALLREFHELEEQSERGLEELG